MKSFILNIGVFIVGIAGGFLLSSPAQNTKLERTVEQMSLNIKNIQFQLTKNKFNENLVAPYEKMSVRELLEEIYSKREHDAK
jgi:hypothetical protein